jgi:hypothetical protein
MIDSVFPGNIFSIGKQITNVRRRKEKMHEQSLFRRTLENWPEIAYNNIIHVQTSHI